MKKAFAVIILALITSGAVTSEVAANPDNTTINANTIRKIRKELVTLPFYGVFDNLAFPLRSPMRWTCSSIGNIWPPTQGVTFCVMASA